MDDALKGFYVLSQSYYAGSVLPGCKYVDEVMFGVFGENGGCEYECAMRWYDLGDGKLPSAKLEIFEDAFTVLDDNKLIKKLIEIKGMNIAVTEFADILISCGYKDLTKRKEVTG